MAEQQTEELAIAAPLSTNHHEVTSDEDEIHSKDYVNYNLVAESDWIGAVTAFESKVKEKLLFKDAGKESDPVRQQFTQDGVEVMKEYLRKSLQILSDDAFHMYNYNAKQIESEEMQKHQQQSEKETTEEQVVEDEDDDSVLEDFEEDELLSEKDLAEVLEQRNRVREQAKNISTCRTLMLERARALAQREWQYLVNQQDAAKDTQHDEMKDTVGGAKELLQYFENQVAEMKQHLLVMDQSLERTSTISTQLRRSEETIQEIKRSFIIQQKDENQPEVLLSQPLSQVEEAIIGREEEDDEEFEKAKHKIFAGFNRKEDVHEGLQSPGRYLAKFMSTIY